MPMYIYIIQLNVSYIGNRCYLHLFTIVIQLLFCVGLKEKRVEAFLSSINCIHYVETSVEILSITNVGETEKADISGTQKTGL